MKGKHVNVASIKRAALQHKILCIIMAISLLCLMIPNGLRANADSEVATDAVATETQNEAAAEEVTTNEPATEEAATPDTPAAAEEEANADNGSNDPLIVVDGEDNPVPNEQLNSSLTVTAADYYSEWPILGETDGSVYVRQTLTDETGLIWYDHTEGTYGDGEFFNDKYMPYAEYTSGSTHATNVSYDSTNGELVFNYNFYYDWYELLPTYATLRLMPNNVENSVAHFEGWKVWYRTGLIWEEGNFDKILERGYLLGDTEYEFVAVFSDYPLEHLVTLNTNGGTYTDQLGDLVIPDGWQYTQEHNYTKAYPSMTTQSEILADIHGSFSVGENVFSKNGRVYYGSITSDSDFLLLVDPETFTVRWGLEFYGDVYGTTGILDPITVAADNLDFAVFGSQGEIPKAEWYDLSSYCYDFVIDESHISDIEGALITADNYAFKLVQYDNITPSKVADVDYYLDYAPVGSISDNHSDGYNLYLYANGELIIDGIQVDNPYKIGFRNGGYVGIDENFAFVYSFNAEGINFEMHFDAINGTDNMLPYVWNWHYEDAVGRQYTGEFDDFGYNQFKLTYDYVGESAYRFTLDYKEATEVDISSAGEGLDHFHVIEYVNGQQIGEGIDIDSLSELFYDSSVISVAPDGKLNIDYSEQQQSFINASNADVYTTSATVEAVATDGFVFAGWTHNGADFIDQTITVGDEPTTQIAAKFAPAPNGPTQTGDGSMSGLLILAIVAIAGVSLFATRKYIVKS